MNALPPTVLRDFELAAPRRLSDLLHPLPGPELQEEVPALGLHLLPSGNPGGACLLQHHHRAAHGG